MGIVGVHEPGPLGPQGFPFVLDALRELAQHLRLHPAFDDGAVLLAHAEAGMSQLQREVPVVGHEDEAFAVAVEPAHGVQVRPLLGQEIRERLASQFVASRGEIATGFVQRDVELAQGLDELALHAHGIPLRVHLGAEHADWLAVDLHAAFNDQAFSGAAGSHASVSQKFLEAEAHGKNKSRCA